MHPGWFTLQLFVILGWSTAMLYITATEFDITELKAIGGIAAGLGGLGVFETLRRNYKKEG